MRRYRLRKRTGVLIVILLVMIDRYTKFWVDTNLPFHDPVTVLPFLSFFRTYNTGVAFSFLSFVDNRILIAITVLILLFVLWLWKGSGRYRWLTRLGFSFITAGAIGNLFDRAFLGHVVDFILFHVGQWSFAVFNLADSFITIGAGMVILDELIVGFRERKQPVDK